MSLEQLKYKKNPKNNTLHRPANIDSFKNAPC